MLRPLVWLILLNKIGIQYSIRLASWQGSVRGIDAKQHAYAREKSINENDKTHEGIDKKILCGMLLY